MTMVINGSGSITGLSAGGLPDATIQQADLATNVAGTGPAFSAYGSAATTLSNGVATKVLFQTERFDTNSNFASSTFTPTVAGYYQINSGVHFAVPAAASNIIEIYKTGAPHSRGNRIPTTTSLFVGLLVTDVVYLNGTTDYVEIYVYTNGGAASTETGNSTYFSGAMVRAA